MCGIFGAVFVDEVQKIDAQAALTAIAHRGPDGRGLLTVGDSVLGHVRLAIIDLSTSANQPMTHGADPALHIVFNGEIYNFKELRRELEQRGEVFRTHSDTETILAGYRVWGDAVVERLEGMFAFALLDERKRRVLLARDRCGEKPLFYCKHQNGLLFGSEIKALIAAGAPAVLDEQSLPHLLAFGYPPSGRSMYRGVAQLPPGHAMTFEGGRLSIRRYWRAPFAEPASRPNDAIASVREAVTKSVEARLVSDVPLGAFLSGGIDSTIIVGVMSRLLGGTRVKTFSIGFAGDARYDETRYARIASRAFGTEHTEFTLQPSSFDLIEKLVWAHDAPFSDSSAIPTSVVSMLARQHVTVALTGDGGDELFCGYPRFLAAEATERIPARARAVLAAVLGQPESAGDRRWKARAARFAQVASLPLADRLASWHSIFLGDLRAILRPELASRLDLDEPIRELRSLVDETRGARPLGRVLGHNFETYLPDDLLVKTDRSSMLHALELRAPFLDTTLIELAARLPDSDKRMGLRTKRILKQAFVDLIPPELMNRKKMGFGIPLGTWFRENLRDYLAEMLGPSARCRDVLDGAYVDNLLGRHSNKQHDYGHSLWLLLTLEVWLRSLRSQTASRASSAA